MPQDILIPAPEGSKYLSEIFNIHTAHGPTLPKNCLFDKVTTGCGGSYVALTSPEPTIIAVPTKALVRDKVTQEKYKRFNILGISQEFPIPEAIPADCSKIICTYQSLPSLAAKLNISNWNLVVDEMHLLTRMISFSKKPLRWLLDNFKSFKSYCFMSATIPKEEHLLPQLKEIDRVTMHWPGLCKVSFECYHAENLQDSILQIIAETLGKASPLSADNVKLFKKVPRSLKTLCEMYIDDPQECQLADPEWYEVIDSLGVDKIKSYEYNKSKLRRLLDGRPEPMGNAVKETLKRRFKVGRTYPSEVIRNYLNELNGSRDSQATELKEVFEVRRTTLKGSPAYKIVRRL